MEAGWFKLDLYRGLFLPAVDNNVPRPQLVEYDRWVRVGADAEPPYPFEGDWFHRHLCFPGRASVYQFGFVQAVDGFSQSIIVTVFRLSHTLLRKFSWEK